MEDPRVTRIADLFREAGVAHHHAFAHTGGADREWPRWYADHVASSLGVLLGHPVDPATLTRTLIQLDERHRRTAPDASWPEFYARALLEPREARVA